jgi:hypothetical protein
MGRSFDQVGNRQDYVPIATFLVFIDVPSGALLHQDQGMQSQPSGDPMYDVPHSSGRSSSAGACAQQWL